MKKLIATLTAATMLCVGAAALAEGGNEPAADNAAAITETEKTENNLFEIRKLILDENNKVTAIFGVYETIAEDENGAPVPTYGTEEFIYQLADGYKYIASADPDEPLGETKEFDDLYQWYVQTYLNGEEPAGGLVFLADVPEAERMDAEGNFWFITAKIELNDAGEVVTMTDFYVPWS